MSQSERVLIAGFGGQGVMLLGQILAYTGNEMGLNSLWFPSYGPETRGGTANCAVTVSDTLIYSPVFSKSDSLIVFNRPSLEKFQHKVEPGGKIFYNSSLIEEQVIEEGVQVYAIPVNEIADQLGNAKVINMVMLGAYLSLTPLFSIKIVESMLKKLLGEQKEAYLSINLAAIQAGISYMKEHY